MLQNKKSLKRTNIIRLFYYKIMILQQLKKKQGNYIFAFLINKIKITVPPFHFGRALEGVAEIFLWRQHGSLS